MVGGQFRLDREAIPQVISDLTEARRHLVELISQVDSLAGHGLVGGDEVSRNAAEQLRRLGLEPAPGSLVTAAHEYLAAVDDAIDALQTMLQLYGRADEITLPAPADFAATVRPGFGPV